MEDISRDHQQQRSSSRNHDSNTRQILLDADEFTTQYRLDHIRDVIRKGALLANDPSDCERVEGLTPSEEAALGNEGDNKSPLSPMLIRSCFFSLLYAVICGYTSYSLAFPTIHGNPDFKLTKDYLLYISRQYVPYLSGSLIGCWLTPTLNRFWARRGTMLAGSIGTFIAAVPPLRLAPGHLPVTIASSITILEGMSMGVTSCTSLIYLAEISSSHARVRILGGIWLLGMSIGYSAACLGLVLMNLIQPTLHIQLFYVLYVLDLILKGVCPFLTRLGCESPRWYVLQGHLDKAFESLRCLQDSEILAARELYLLQAWVTVKRPFLEHSNHLKQIAQLFSVPHIRRATLASITVMVTGSLAGNGLVAIALPHTYKFGFDVDIIRLIQMIYPLICSCAVWGTLYGTIRRRRLYLASLFLMFWISFALWWSSPLTPPILALVLLYVFIIISTVGLGLVSFLYAAEIFPTSHRDVGVALSMCIYQICQTSVAVLLFIIPNIDNFCIMTVVTLLSWLAVYLFMRESEQYRLEEMQSASEMSTREFILYRLRTDFLNPLQRYVLRRRVRVQQVEAQGIYTDEEAISLAS